MRDGAASCLQAKSCPKPSSKSLNDLQNLARYNVWLYMGLACLVSVYTIKQPGNIDMHHLRKVANPCPKYLYKYFGPGLALNFASISPNSLGLGGCP